MSGEFNAFFYGTLVFYSVCYGNKQPPRAIRDLHTFTPALLDNYCRHRVRFADYPGILEEDGCSVRGIFVTGLTSANLHKLDYFEGSEYKQVTTKVRLFHKSGDEEIEGETKDAIVYVYLNPKALERREWDFEEFRQQKMLRWTRQGCQF
ncbi:Protein AIG2 [Escovopsis weberi]|uniref:Putative gamma-glutamylcyclotransferase n=1 Tax=Escovopsis weberi TaxID=150374 RepID=A0A0M9VTK3_ESCWE|nr:Protein AIG2 [Escovopsis weberi]